MMVEKREKTIDRAWLAVSDRDVVVGFRVKTHQGKQRQPIESSLTT